MKKCKAYVHGIPSNYYLSVPTIPGTTLDPRTI